MARWNASDEEDSDLQQEKLHHRSIIWLSHKISESDSNKNIEEQEIFMYLMNKVCG